MNIAALYEIRRKIQDYIMKYEYILKPAGKFLLSLVLLFIIKGDIGYNAILCNSLLLVIISLVCALVPVGFISAIIGLVILGHLYRLSLESAVMGAVVLLLIFLLYFRFSPRDVLLLLLTPLAIKLNIHYALPVAAGLLCAPTAAAPVAIGVLVTGFLEKITANEILLSGGGEVGRATLLKLRFLIDTMVQNHRMWVTAAVFVLTTIIVYAIRRLAISNAWLLAIIAGTLAEVIGLTAGGSCFGARLDGAALFMGLMMSLLIEWAIMFMKFNVDYRLIESVQFEDDDYYYFVKAVPKVTVPGEDGLLPAGSLSETTADLKNQFVKHRPGGRKDQADGGGKKS